jgi:HEAT repeat protein
MGLFGPDVRKLEAAGDVSGLIQVLTVQADAQLRHAAALSLGNIGDGRAAEPLIRALQDSSPSVRQAAAWALGRTRDVRAVEPLISALKSSDKSVRDAAGAAIGSFGALTVEPLAAAYRAVPNGADWPEREAIVRALSGIGLPAVAPLVEALGDKVQNVRAPAVDALVRIGAPALGPLAASLASPSDSMRKAVIQVLDTLRWQPGRTESGAVYWLAKGEWGKCVEIGAPAVGIILATVKDRGRQTRKTATDALVQMGAPAVEPLVAALTDPDEYVRAAAVAALGMIGDARAVEPLMARLKDDKGWVIMDAAVALGKIGDPRAVEPLIAILGPRSQIISGFRQTAARALVAMYQAGRLGPAERKRLLAQRDEITRRHDDSQEAASDCNGGGHTDTGIGVDFPLDVVTAAPAQPTPHAAIVPAPAPANAAPAAAPPPIGPAGWAPTHLVPHEGMAFWQSPDPTRPAGGQLPANGELMVEAASGAWAQVRAVNGWRGWVDGRLLVGRR